MNFIKLNIFSNYFPLFFIGRSKLKLQKLKYITIAILTSHLISIITSTIILDFFYRILEFKYNNGDIITHICINIITLLTYIKYKIRFKNIFINISKIKIKYICIYFKLIKIYTKTREQIDPVAKIIAPLIKKNVAFIIDRTATYEGITSIRNDRFT